MKRRPWHLMDAAGLADGSYVVLVTGGKVQGLVAPAAAGGSLTVQDENGDVAAGVTRLDFQGAGVTATAGTGEVVVTIPGGAGGGGAPARQVLRLTRTTKQSIPTGAQTAVIWETSTRNSFSTSPWSSTSNPSRVTAQIAGQYLIRARGKMETMSAGGVAVGHLYRNGTTEIDNDFRHTSSGNWASVFVTSEVTMAVGDYLELKLEQRTGSSQLSGAGPETWLEFEYLGPTL